MDSLTPLTYEAASVDEEFVPSAGREEEGGENQEHRDEAGQDDASPVGGGGALEVEGEGDVRVVLLYAGVGVVVLAGLALHQLPLLVVGVELEVLHGILVVVQPQLDLTTVPSPASELEFAGVTLVWPQSAPDYKVKHCKHITHYTLHITHFTLHITHYTMVT